MGVLARIAVDAERLKASLPAISTGVQQVTGNIRTLSREAEAAAGKLAASVSSGGAVGEGSVSRQASAIQDQKLDAILRYLAQQGRDNLTIGRSNGGDFRP